LLVVEPHDDIDLLTVDEVRLAVIQPAFPTNATVMFRGT